MELFTPEVLTAASGVIAAVCAFPLGAFYKGRQERLDGFNRARREHIEDLERWRDKMASDYEALHTWAEYYRSMAADYAFQLRSHGIEPETTVMRPTTPTR